MSPCSSQSSKNVRGAKELSSFFLSDSKICKLSHLFAFPLLICRYAARVLLNLGIRRVFDISTFDSNHVARKRCFSAFLSVHKYIEESHGCSAAFFSVSTNGLRLLPCLWLLSLASNYINIDTLPVNSGSYWFLIQISNILAFRRDYRVFFSLSALIKCEKKGYVCPSCFGSTYISSQGSRSRLLCVLPLTDLVVSTKSTALQRCCTLSFWLPNQEIYESCSSTFPND